MQLAEDMGLKVERRIVAEEELATFEEAGACGTAAVISPILRIDDLSENRSYEISKTGKQARSVRNFITSCGLSNTATSPTAWLGNHCIIKKTYSFHSA